MLATPRNLAREPATVPVPALVSVVSLQNVDLVVSIALTVIAIVLIGALAVAVWREWRNDTIVISPIAVPSELAARGYEPHVVAARLLDAYRDLHAESGTYYLQRRTQRALGMPDVQLPGGRTSMRGIVRYLRQLFGHPAAEVDGEVTREDGGYVLRLRFGGTRIEPVHGERAPDLGIANVLRGGAEDLMLITDPGTLGARVLRGERAGGQFTHSERIFRHATHSSTAHDRARGLTGLARIRELQGHLDEAESLFQRALAEGSASTAALHAYLLVLLEQVRVDDAIAVARRFAATARTREQREAAALGLIDVRRNAEALPIIDRLLKRDPANGVLRMLRGRANAGLYRWPAAVAAFERATEREPWVFNWQQYLAWALAQAGRTDEALQLVRPIAHLHNGDEWGRYCLGVAELEAGNADRALAALAVAHAATPTRASAAGQYARALAAVGRGEEALAVIAPIVRHPALSPRIAWVEGLIDESLGRHDAALACFSAAAESDPDDPAPRRSVAALLVRLGRTQEAAARQREADALAARNAAFK